MVTPAGASILVDDDIFKATLGTWGQKPHEDPVKTTFVLRIYLQVCLHMFKTELHM